VLGDNTFGHNPDYRGKELATGIRISDSENINLNGFLIQDAQAGKHTVTNAVPIERDALVELVRCRRVNMTGCQILDGTPTGVLIDDCEDTLISSCTIIDQREAKMMKTGVDWRGSTRGNMLVQSRIGGARKAVSALDELVQNGNLTD
jgi:polygalacturonase